MKLGNVSSSLSCQRGDSSQGDIELKGICLVPRQRACPKGTHKTRRGGGMFRGQNDLKMTEIAARRLTGGQESFPHGGPAAKASHLANARVRYEPCSVHAAGWGARFDTPSCRDV